MLSFSFSRMRRGQEITLAEIFPNRNIKNRENVLTSHYLQQENISLLRLFYKTLLLSSSSKTSFLISVLLFFISLLLLCSIVLWVCSLASDLHSQTLLLSFCPNRIKTKTFIFKGFNFHNLLLFTNLSLFPSQSHDACVSITKPNLELYNESKKYQKGNWGKKYNLYWDLIYTARVLWIWLWKHLFLLSRRSFSEKESSSSLLWSFHLWEKQGKLPNDIHLYIK